MQSSTPEAKPEESRFAQAWPVSLALVSQNEGSEIILVSRSIESADVAQMVEHFLGKEEVGGSIPLVSSRIGV
ncbi:MAG: hypothetical protein RL156_1112 [Bacteroidota bacterium]